MKRRFAPHRSYEKEIELQAARYGVRDELVAGYKLDYSNSDGAGEATLRSCNAGRDVKFACDVVPRGLHGSVSKESWHAFASEANARLKHYRAKKAENYILAFSLMMPPAVGFLIARERKRWVKICASLAVSCTCFNNNHSDGTAELQFDRDIAKRDVAKSVRIRCMKKVASSSKSTGKGEKQVRALLRREGMESAADAVIEDGFDTLERLYAATFDDLYAAGVKRGHARAIAKLSSKQKESSGKSVPAEPTAPDKQDSNDLLLDFSSVPQQESTTSFNPFD